MVSGTDNLISEVVPVASCEWNMRRSSRSSQNIEADLRDLFRGWADLPVAKRGYSVPKLLDRPNLVPDKEAQKELLRCGCNYVTYCVTMDFLASEKSRIENKYGVELEAYFIPYTFKERAGYLLGVVIPYHLIHPPRLIQ